MQVSTTQPYRGPPRWPPPSRRPAPTPLSGTPPCRPVRRTPPSPQHRGLDTQLRRHLGHWPPARCQQRHRLPLELVREWTSCRRHQYTSPAQELKRGVHYFGGGSPGPRPQPRTGEPAGPGRPRVSRVATTPAVLHGIYRVSACVAERRVIHHDVVFCGAGVGCCGTALESASNENSDLPGYPQGCCGTHYRSYNYPLATPAKSHGDSSAVQGQSGHDSRKGQRRWERCTSSC